MWYLIQLGGEGRGGEGRGGEGYITYHNPLFRAHSGKNQEGQHPGRSTTVQQTLQQQKQNNETIGNFVVTAHLLQKKAQSNILYPRTS